MFNSIRCNFPLIVLTLGECPFVRLSTQYSASIKTNFNKINDHKSVIIQVLSPLEIKGGSDHLWGQDIFWPLKFNLTGGEKEVFIQWAKSTISDRCSIYFKKKKCDEGKHHKVKFTTTHTHTPTHTLCNLVGNIINWTLNWIQMKYTL